MFKSAIAIFILIAICVATRTAVAQESGGSDRLVALVQLDVIKPTRLGPGSYLLGCRSSKRIYDPESGMLKPRPKKSIRFLTIEYEEERVVLCNESGEVLLFKIGDPMRYTVLGGPLSLTN